MSAQHTHASTPFFRKTHSIYLVCDQVTSPANIGGLFRLADAFGIKQILFSSEIDLSSSRLRKTARGTESKVAFKESVQLTEELIHLKMQGYVLLGLEITSTSIALQQLTISEALKTDKVALVVGSEKHGISPTILDLLDTTTHINMFGANSSMNVTQATAIALFSLTQHSAKNS